MFEPRWSEGQGLSEESPSEVLLPEDDAYALRIICCVIHHRNNDVPEVLTSREVLQIAILADKYDLAVALKYARERWLKPGGNFEALNMGYLMAAAFLFGDIDAFVAITLRLILDYKGSYMELLDDETIRQLMPWEMFCMQ
jgi:hypothetical protein